MHWSVHFPIDCHSQFESDRIRREHVSDVWTAQPLHVFCRVRVAHERGLQPLHFNHLRCPPELAHGRQRLPVAHFLSAWLALSSIAHHHPVHHQLGQLLRQEIVLV